MTSSVDCTSTLTDPTRDDTVTVEPSTRPRAARSSGCMSSWCRGRPFVSRSVLCIHELQSCLCRRPMRSSSPSSGAATVPSRARSPSTRAGASSSVLVAGAEPAGELVGAERAEVDALGALAQPGEGDPGVSAGEQQLDHPGRAERHPRPKLQPVDERAPPAEPVAHPEREVPVDLPVVPRAALFREHRGREARGVADRQDVEDQVVVVPFEGRRRREDHVGVPGRLVDVDVDGGHELQAVECPVEARRRRAWRARGCRRV